MKATAGHLPTYVVVGIKGCTALLSSVDSQKPPLERKQAKLLNLPGEHSTASSDLMAQYTAKPFSQLARLSHNNCASSYPSRVHLCHFFTVYEMSE